ncbi:MAG: hypothetical protein ACFFCD_18255 [Promethearchaeota archaeon]
METTKLKKLQEDEDERCQQQATCVAKLASRNHDLSSLIRTMYEDKIRVRQHHSYHRTGNLGRTAFLSPVTVVEVFPWPTPVAFRQAIGLYPQELVNLARKQIVYPLIHSYETYKTLDYLDPILALKPPSYQSRGRAFLDAISNNKFEVYFQKAVTDPLLRGDHCFPLPKEPYEKAIVLSKKEMIRKAAWRYAAMCCILGEDTIESLGSQDKQKIANYIHTLHVMYLHPITHGLLGNIHNETKDYATLLMPEYIGIAANVESILVSALDLSVPKEPTYLDIMRAHNQGLPIHFRTLEQNLLEELKSAQKTGSLSLEEEKSRIEEELYKLEEKLAELSSAIQVAQTTGTVGFLGGGTLSLLAGLETVGSVLFGLSAAPPVIVEPLVRQVAKVTSPVLSHYWSLKKHRRK